jgi:small-conductance mechanosensitive channel
MNTNYRFIPVIILYLLSLPIIKSVGKRLERITRKDLLSLWLSEIGSDVRLYGFLSSTLISIGIISDMYIDGLYKPLITGIKIIVSLWIFLGLIAFIEVAEKYLKSNIINSNVSEIDKRNYLTLIPVAASIFKVFSYGFISLSVLSSLGVDIAPILNIGAIGLGALMFAGSETIKDILATLKFFLSRKLYVGSYVKINGFKPGYVTRITIIDTWITTKLSDGSELIQIIGNGSIQTIIILQPPASDF